MIFAEENNRVIPTEDKVFSLSGRAKAAIRKKGKDAVINATIGALLDDDGELVIMSSVAEAISSLSPEDYAEYAPIAGTPAFQEAVKRALFGKLMPSGHVRVCATPGGTGSITSVIANYSKRGEAVLTHDWCWANYKSICSEHGRKMETFRFFDDEGNFNDGDLKKRINELAAVQDQIVLMLNTPAHNPTGYSMTLDDWDKVINILNDAPCRTVLFIDVAYIDYAGEDEEVRAFIPKLEKLKDTVLPIFGYSASKTLTAYGMRCGTIVCMAKEEEVAEEFKRVTGFSARATWSNGNRSVQVVMGKIFSDPKMLEKATKERRGYRDMLLERGRTFERVLRENGVECVPFDAGFFATIACDDPAWLGAELEKQDIYCVSLAKGIRVSIASISKEKCIRCAEAIAKLLNPQQ